MDLFRNNPKRYVFVIAVIILGISVYTFFYIDTLKPKFSTIDENVAQSIVHIEVGNTYNKLYGTGFFVAPDLIATNIHVVAVPGQITIRKAINNESRVIIIKDIKQGFQYKKSSFNVIGVSAYDVENDLVVLKVDGNSQFLPLADSNEVKENDRIMSIGYPHEQFKLSKSHIYSKRESDQWLRIAVNIGSGASGSPVYNEVGNVVGIVTYSNHSFDYTLAIPSNVLRTLLAESGTIEPLVGWYKRDEIRAYTYHMHGRSRFYKRHFTEAITQFDYVLELNDKAIYTYYKRGAAKIKLGELAANVDNIRDTNRYYSASIEDFTQAILLNPIMNAEAYTQRAHANMNWETELEQYWITRNLLRSIQSMKQSFLNTV